MKKTILILILLSGALNLMAQPITGATSVCAGSATSLTDASPGGIWASSTLSVATIDSFSGNLNGIAPGTSIITYYFSGGGSVSATITVNALPAAISGTSSVCAGSAIIFTDATTGGLWSSSNNLVAMIDDSTGVLVGISGDTASIYYTGANGCSKSVLVTVNAMPPAIIATSVYCVGATDTLYEIGGGTWSTSTPAIISIGAAAGNITGLTQGAASITYTLPSGCAAYKTITVNPAANAGTVTGNDFVCLSNSTTLASNACCGVWSSSDASIASVGSLTGTVNGLAAGVVMIKYGVTNSCGTDTALFALEILSTDTCNKLSVNNLNLVKTVLNIIPNPSNGEFSITLNSDKTENSVVVITNITGDKVKEFNTLTNKKNDIKLDTPAGIYFITVNTEHGNYNGKLVVE